MTRDKRLPGLRRHAAVHVMVTALTCMAVPPASTQEAESPIAVEIERRLADEPRAGSSALRFEAELLTFYRARTYSPVWLGNPDTGLTDLLEALNRADEDGLQLGAYASDQLSVLPTLRTNLPPATLAEYELALSDAMLRLASDLFRGRVDPGAFPGEWAGQREPFDAVAALTQAAGSGVGGMLKQARPAHSQYQALQGALASMRRASEWPQVPEGGTLRSGDWDPRVEVARRRLLQTGDLPAAASPSADPMLFDSPLEQAVRQFQVRHGLEADGLLGSKTVQALNVPASRRLRQITANMERWRWLPNDLGDRRLIVNVPDFSVTMEGPGLAATRVRAIVGRTDRETPTFSSVIESFSLAPYWNVPSSLARKDVLPAIRRDAGYFERTGMTVLDRSSGELVAPASIDWSSISNNDFLARYRLRQEPGAANSLGNVRISFPNPYAVFVHDTPLRSLFDETSRAFSSGCIRVDESLEVLQWLLDGDPAWSEPRITEVITAGKERSSRIREPVPIHLVYITAVVDDAGRIGFLPDIYGLDWRLEQALGTTLTARSSMEASTSDTCA